MLSVSVMLRAVVCAQDELIQAAAQQELCAVAEEGVSHGRGGISRRSLFQDESGSSWHLPAQLCLNQVLT